MIYISTGCVKSSKMVDSIQTLASHGFSNIELTGGSKYYNGLIMDLMRMRKQHGLSYVCHNYFPPPKQDFVLNLASLNSSIFERTVQHLKTAVKLSHRLNASVFSFHAGFLIDFDAQEVGARISKHLLSNREKALQQFCRGYELIQDEANGLELYIENNVYSQSNREMYPENPFLLTSCKDYLELSERIHFNLLLDVGHLKVSAYTLGLDFLQQALCLIPHARYLHLSDNDGFQDQNCCIEKQSPLSKLLSQFDLQSKMVTLEYYESIKKIKQSFPFA